MCCQGVPGYHRKGELGNLPKGVGRLAARLAVPRFHRVKVAVKLLFLLPQMQSRRAGAAIRIRRALPPRRHFLAVGILAVDPNPCLACGICCTHFRISFYWAEADDAPGGYVPHEMTEVLTPHLRCMKGSNSVPRRCIGLSGEIGQAVACTVYEQRPSPCREFPVFLDDGTPNPKCNELRERIALPPLEARTAPIAV